MALHHRLMHVLGSSFNTPHAETHAILLPHTAAFNAVVVPDFFGPAQTYFWRDTQGGSVGFCHRNQRTNEACRSGPDRGRS